MPAVITSGDPYANRLLAALEPEDLDRLDPWLDRVELRRGIVLLDPGARLAHVWFPTGCVVSLAVTLRDGTAEGAVVGREGAVGLLEALGSRRVTARSLVQVPGPALRLPLAMLEPALERSPALRRLCASYVQAFAAEALQAAACNALHRAEPRLACCLLTLQDRAGGVTALPVTQALIGGILGLQRTTVTETALALQRAGLIACRRGVVEIRDRAGLEAASCGCHAAIQRQLARLCPELMAGTAAPLMSAGRPTPVGGLP